MRLSDLVDQLDLPETDVATGTWDAARRRTRRRHAVTAGVSAAVLAVVVTASALSLYDGSQDPAPVSPTPTPAPTRPAHSEEPSGIDHSNTQRLLTPGLWDGLDDSVPTLDPVEVTDLADDPMSEGRLAVADPDDQAVPLVLGSDGRWRRISVPGLVPISDGRYTSPVIRPTAFSPDGTQLALPQPDSLVVVDLTDGSHRTYPTPGKFWSVLVWVDLTHVLVASESQTTGTVIDLDTGETSPSEYHPDTAFTDDDALTWGNDPVQDSVLEWARRPDVPTRANNAGGLNPFPPLIKDDIAVGYMAVEDRLIGSEDPPLGTGPVVVDATTGDVLAYMPTSPASGSFVLLGWQENLPVLGLLDNARQHHMMAIAAWDYEQAELQPLAQISIDRLTPVSVALHGSIG